MTDSTPDAAGRAARLLHRRIKLEASSFCQLKCPSCPTATGETRKAIPGGFLRREAFRKLIDDNPWLMHIELSNYGEALLNPHLPEILALAHERQVAVSLGNGVNLNHAKDAVLEALVKYGVRAITCSIDGASEETYKVYRVGGSLARVLDNIRAINRWKRHYGSETPRLNWQFVVFGHNEHEIPAARRMAQELGMGFYAKLSWDAAFSPIQDPKFVKEQTGFAVTSREEHKRVHNADYTQGICHQLWKEPQVNWDGKVLGCCRNFWGDFGANAFADGLVNALNSERMTHARAMLRGEAPPRDDIPCTTCEIYHWRQKTQQWVDK